jgi:hypothetical protein
VLDPFERLIEERIREAEARGEFKDLAGQGLPLPDRDPAEGVPADLRAAYTLLANAGCLPEELQLRKESLRLEDLLSSLDPEAPEARALSQRKSLLELRYELLLERQGRRAAPTGYAGRLAGRLGRRLA